MNDDRHCLIDVEMIVPFVYFVILFSFSCFFYCDVKERDVMYEKYH